MIVFCLSGCIRTVPTHLPQNEAAYAIMAKSQAAAYSPDYAIEPGDKLRVQIFQEPDLSVDQLLVDPSGHVSLPLLGAMRASGVTPAKLESQIQAAYGAHYLRNPKVSVSMYEAVDRTASVEGEVKQPGIYIVNPNTTLLSMIAQAKSPTQTAKLSEVLVFRNVDGQRMGARFDIAMIRAGRAEDPKILPNDVVVVGYSRVLGAYRDLLQTVPLLSVFKRY